MDGVKALTPRQEFKKCLIDGWLTTKVWQCATMIMIDHGVTHETSNGLPNFPLIENWLWDIGVPKYPNMEACRYIAAFYPRTSAALFEKSKDVLKIFWKEKQQAPDSKDMLSRERRYQNKKDKTVIFVRLRSLSKKHDWKTVK